MKRQPITTFFVCKTPKLKPKLQTPITKTFEFFEFLHLICQENINLLIKLWLVGNKEMRNLMQKYLKGLNDENFYYTMCIVYKHKSKIPNINKNQKVMLLKIFTNIEYLRFSFDRKINFVKFAKHIPNSVKILHLCSHEIKNSEIKLLPKTLTYLKINAKKLVNPIDLPRDLTNLSLYNCQNLTIDFLNNLPYKITTLKFYHLTIVNFELKLLVNLVSLDLNHGQIKTFVLENCLDLKTLDLHKNELIEFPQSILKLTNLESLNLRWNKLSQIPKEFSQLENLKYLDLCENKLIEFPTAIFMLLKLKTLGLNENQITKIFILDSKLENLKKLDLSGNFIIEIHLQLPKLKILNLNLNNIIDLNLQTPTLKELHIVNNDNVVYNIPLPKLTKVYN